MNPPVLRDIGHSREDLSPDFVEGVVEGFTEKLIGGFVHALGEVFMEGLSEWTDEGMLTVTLAALKSFLDTHSAAFSRKDLLPASSG